MNRILLVEDSIEMQTLIRRLLEDRGQITIAATAKEARQQIEKQSFDLILLDVMLPDSDGFHLCAEFRNHASCRDTSVVFITSKEEVSDKVTGFSLGADDYIVKPFEPREFRARIESKLKKIRDQHEKEDWVKIGDLSLNLSMQRVFCHTPSGETDLSLTPNEFKLLHYLIRNEERVISRDQLLTTVWSDRGIHVMDRTIDKHISALRKKLTSNTHFIETIPNVGYRIFPKRTI